MNEVNLRLVEVTCTAQGQSHIVLAGGKSGRNFYSLTEGPNRTSGILGEDGRDLLGGFPSDTRADPEGLFLGNQVRNL